MSLYLRSGDTRHRLWHGAAIQSIHVEFTDKCNAGCPMCPRTINNGAEPNPLLPKAEISLAEFRAWFPERFVGTLNKLFACGNYGDPIIARDTLDIYEYLRATNDRMTLAMHTNGAARTPEWWAALGRTMNGSGRGDYCTFGIDGLADTNHLYRRNTRFDLLMANVEAFIGAGGVAHWDFIVFEHNEHQVEAAKALARRLGFENFNLKRTSRWHRYEDGRGAFDVRNRKGGVDYTLRQPESDDLRDSTFKLLRENLARGPNYVTNAEFERMEAESPYHVLQSPAGPVTLLHREFDVLCRAVKGAGNLNNEIFLSATGHVFPCCYLGGEPWRHGWPRERDSFLQMVDLNGGMDSIDLHRWSLAEIVASPLYDEMLGRSLGKGHPMRSRQCSTCCGREWNKLEGGEVGAKHEGYLDADRNGPSGRA